MASPANTAAFRAGVIELTQALHPTHWLTLNTHRDCSMGTALEHLKRWRVEVLRRVHGQKFYALPPDQVVTYVGFPEFSAAGHPHFHLAVFVPTATRHPFEPVAHSRWKQIVRSGTSHLVPIGEKPEDRRVVLGYATKCLDPDADVPFIDSRVSW